MLANWPRGSTSLLQRLVNIENDSFTSYNLLLSHLQRTSASHPKKKLGCHRPQPQFSGRDAVQSSSLGRLGSKRNRTTNNVLAAAIASSGRWASNACSASLVRRNKRANFGQVRKAKLSADGQRRLQLLSQDLQSRAPKMRAAKLRRRAVHPVAPIDCLLSRRNERPGQRSAPRSALARATPRASRPSRSEKVS